MTGRFKCSMMDCINDTQKACQNIINHRKSNTKHLIEYLGDDVKNINEIVFVGSGTSNTSAVTSKSFVEKVTRIRTIAITSNDFLYNTYVYSPNALYVFTSQTGTSIVALEALKFIQDKGYYHVAVSESDSTPIAKAADCFVTMDCGIEEYPMRTTGYCASVLTHMIIGLEIGLARNTISEAEYESYIKDAEKISESHKSIVQKTLSWLEYNKRKMLRSDMIIFTGADSLYGITLEGAMKVWETVQVASAGYEIEEGLHGPNYGYNYRHCVIVLNDGKRENKKCLALANYMKDVWNNGFVAGANVIDGEDLQFEVQTNDFCALEFAPVVQVIAYVLAKDQGRDLFAHHDNSRMESYFKTHS